MRVPSAPLSARAVGAVAGTVGGILGVQDRPRFRTYVVQQRVPSCACSSDLRRRCGAAGKRRHLLRHAGRIYTRREYRYTLRQRTPGDRRSAHPHRRSGHRIISPSNRRKHHDENRNDRSGCRPDLAALPFRLRPAQARDGGAVAAGIIGGLAVGAVVGSQINRNDDGYRLSQQPRLCARERCRDAAITRIATAVCTSANVRVC